MSMCSLQILVWCRSITAWHPAQLEGAASTALEAGRGHLSQGGLGQSVVADL